MKLREMTNEQAMNTVADLIDPVCEIASRELLTMISKKDFRGAVKKLLREHQGAVIAILAALNGVPVEQYRFNPIELVTKGLAVLNDPDVMQLFTSQLRTVGTGSSGDASAGTGAAE